MCDKPQPQADAAEDAANAFEHGYTGGAARRRERNREMGVAGLISSSPNNGLEFDVDHVFSYHAPAPWQLAQFELIRSAAKTLAIVIEANTPQCADRMDALRKVREAVMTANAAIALGGRLSKL